MKTFEETGKRMPYAESREYLNQLIDTATDKAIKRVAEHGDRDRRMTIKMGTLWKSALAAAAVVGLCAVVTRLWKGVHTTDSFANVELAYDQLSTEDQEYLQLVYEDDLFITQFDNDNEP